MNDKITVIVIGAQGSGKSALAGVIRQALAEVDIPVTGERWHRYDLCVEILHKLAPNVTLIEIEQ